MCQYSLNEWSNLATSGLDPTPFAVSESEDAVLCPCALSESKAADGSDLASMMVFKRAEATLRPRLLSESKIADGLDLACSTTLAIESRFPALMDEVTLPILAAGRMAGGG